MRSVGGGKYGFSKRVWLQNKYYPEGHGTADNFWSLDELRDLLSGTIENKYVALSALSESLTIVGFYLASIAYGLFYQAGIVHAAEARAQSLYQQLASYHADELSTKRNARSDTL